MKTKIKRISAIKYFGRLSSTRHLKGDDWWALQDDIAQMLTEFIKAQSPKPCRSQTRPYVLTAVYTLVRLTTLPIGLDKLVDLTDICLDGCDFSSKRIEFDFSGASLRGASFEWATQ